MKILYLSCHAILEKDELDILSSLDHYVFSPGSYVEAENPGDESMRPKNPPPTKFASLYAENMAEWHTLGRPGIDNKELLTVDFVKKFDLVLIMHLPQWISANWAIFKKANLPVVLRTIGQNISSNEDKIRPFRKDGLKIIRYSPKERRIPGYVGEDILIRFAKDPSEFSNWNGNTNVVISSAQHMIKRDFACNYTFFEEISRPFPRKLYGPGNEAAGTWAMGKVSFEELKAAMRDHRAYFCGGTHPASYVLGFIEAWMTGCPILVPGIKKGNASYFPGHMLAEYTDFIENGVNGLASDSVLEHQEFIKLLCNDHEFAKKISAAGRDSAIKLFGIDGIKEQWRVYLNSF